MHKKLQVQNFVPEKSTLEFDRKRKEHEEMLNITSHQGNENQMYNEVSPHIDQNGLIKNPTTVNSAEAVERREPSCTVGGNVNQYTH